MKAIARSQRVLRAPGSGRAWTRDVTITDMIEDELVRLEDRITEPRRSGTTSRRGAAAHCGKCTKTQGRTVASPPQSTRDTARPVALPPQGRFDRQSFGRHRRHLGHELAAALHTYPFPHAFPPCRPVGPRVLRFPFPQIPTRHGQLPDEETRTMVGAPA